MDSPMTTNPRFLALVAKVDEVEHHAKYELASSPRVSLKDLDKLLAPYRALKGEIMRHEPEVRYVNPEYGGSFDSEEDALDGWDLEIDGVEGKPEITTFVVCKGCAQVVRDFTDLHECDDWVFPPEVYFPCKPFLDIEAEVGK